jgi:plastocyanin
MHLGLHIRRPRLRFAWVALGLVLLGLAALGARPAPTPSQAPTACPDMAAMGSKPAMSEAEMAKMSAARYGATPAHGSAINVVAADTFLVSNFQFNADHNPATQVDVVRITAGQSVLFKWVSGIHTTTSGTPSDAIPGTIWDGPVDSIHKETLVSFPTPGTYPFFCVFHGDFNNMVGTIVVDNGATPTTPKSWGKVKARYR